MGTYFRSIKEREQYAHWLQEYNWDYFMTSTFRRPLKDPYYALQNVWRALERHNVARGFIVAEPFKSGDLHIHGIVSGRGGGWRPDIDLPWDIWGDLFKTFGRAKVELCNDQAAVASYCSKYILKDQNNVRDHYEVFGSKHAWKGGLISAN